MKIAIVCPYSWSAPGGVANHIGALAGRLRNRGHDVKIIAPVDGTVPSGVVGVGRSIGVPYNGSVARIAFGPRVGMRIRSALRGYVPDIVHVHEPFAPSTGMLATLVSEAPVVATFHAAAPESRVYRFAAPALRPLWRKITVRIAVSEEAKRTVERAFGDGLRIIPNGIALERFAAAGSAPEHPAEILFVGRLERRKGAAILLDAFRRLRAAVPEATLTIVGEGPERPALERRASALPVTFRGRLEPGELSGALAGAALLAAPSLGGESFGIVLLEAMAAGRPVVASSIPGYAAVVRHGVDGILVPPGDAAALAEALAESLRDPERAAAMGRSGREHAARYSWDVVATQIELAYGDARR